MTTEYGGVLVSTWTFIVRVKRAVIADVTENAATNTSANDEYALAA
jgi:hypothetical protein